MTRDFTVIKVGTDTSGRTIWMTRFAWDVWQAVLRHPDVVPFADKITIVQGAFMLRNGGGASPSAGYHDEGGCWDVRTWNLTTAELNTLIRVCRFEAAIAAWRRDLTSAHGGMDPHCHVTAGWDRPLSSGAASSWGGYLRGTNGLANGARDYEVRPVPLVTQPKASLMREDYMGTDAAKKQLDQIQAALAGLENDIKAGQTADEAHWAGERARWQADRDRQSRRYQNLVSKIGGLVDQFIEAGNTDAAQAVKGLLTAEVDVTGKDNPA